MTQQSMTMVRKMSKLVALNQEDHVLRNMKFSKNKMVIFSEQQNTGNPFEITESNVEDVQFTANIISDDERDDVDIEKKNYTFFYS